MRMRSGRGRARRAIVLAVLALAVSSAWAGPDPEVPKPAPQTPGGAWKNVLKSRPRLLGPRAHLVALSKAKPEAWRAILQEPTRNDLFAAAVHAVDGLTADQIKPFLEAVRADVAAGPTNLHQDTWIRLNRSALAFDAFHDSFPADERTKIVEWMNAHLGFYLDDETAFHNSTLSKIWCYLQVAYATWGENPRAKEWRDYALETLYKGKLVPVLKEFGRGGGFTECGWYTRGSLWHLVQALELARRVEGYDGFQEAPSFYYQRLAYELHQPYPGLWTYGAERYPVEGDGSIVYGGHNEYPRFTRTLLAQYFRGSEPARFTASRRRKPSNPEAAFVDFLIEEDLEKPADLAALPTAHLASGIGRLYARSDWTDDATWLRFECGDFWSHHQHFETGNFEIFRREPLATESGEYEDFGSDHSVNWLLRTIAHNCILVRQPDETWPQMRDGGRHPYANDGGQTKTWEWTVGDLDAWKAKRAGFERGDIVAYENQPRFLYVAADCTASYARTKLDGWVRQIVFLRPHAIVVFDRVAAVRPEYEKTWLLHCREKPTVDETTVTIASGKGRLVSKTLLPEDAVLRTVEGYTYGGRSFAPPTTAQTPEACKWRLEVAPGKARKEDLFLHVLFTDAPQTAKLLRKGSKVGVEIGAVELLFDGPVGGALSLGGKKHPLEPEVKLGKHE